VPKSVPRFLDLDLDDQQQRFLLQAWMYSEAPALLSEPNDAALAHLRHSYRHVVEYETNALTVVSCAGTQIQFAIPDLVINTSSNVCDFLDFCGQATATADPIFPSHAPAPFLPDKEPESASIETERVIAFRSIRPEAREALHPSNVRLSPQAASFVAKARSRQFRFEENDEQQSE
jgi:hypothetical protein